MLKAKGASNVTSAGETRITTEFGAGCGLQPVVSRHWGGQERTDTRSRDKKTEVTERDPRFLFLHKHIWDS